MMPEEPPPSLARRWLRVLFPMLLATAPARGVFAGDAERVTFEGVVFQVFRAKPAEVELHWKNGAGQPYAQFSVLQAALEAKGREVVFMMNAGIFEPGGVPSGLHVENGREWQPVNLREGKGNFYLKPNGVFAITTDGARVMESPAYAAAGLAPRLALQSGPLLLSGGKIHPAFQAASPNKKHRNGVGVAADGTVVFAMTEFNPVTNRVNLHGCSSISAVATLCFSMETSRRWSSIRRGRCLRETGLAHSWR
jgi:uncharacterized protein YigE (DUF2233 family)